MSVRISVVPRVEECDLEAFVKAIGAFEVYADVAACDAPRVRPRTWTLGSGDATARFG
jgi:hypothetical protein